MAQRKAWTREQDQALIDVIQVKNVKKWSAISKAMQTDYGIHGRTGKQCRERWHNQLDPVIKNEQWSLEEQKILFLNHTKYGNKWAKISQQLQGRTDNCVKNHFYSILRRSFKRLNRFIAQHKGKYNLKQLKPVILTKLNTIFSEKFSKIVKLTSAVMDKSVEIKDKLLLVSKVEQDTQESEIQMEKLVREIVQFSKSYKRRKTKKVKEESELEDQLEIEEEEMSAQLIKESHEYIPLFLSQQEYCSTIKYPEPFQPLFLTQPLPLFSPQPQPHANLFTFSPCQVVTSSKQVSEAKQSHGAFQLVHRPSSRISQDPPQQLTMLKKGSNYSSWSMNLNKLPLRERVSELSLNRSNSNVVEFNVEEMNAGGEFKNMFGCDLEQLDK